MLSKAKFPPPPPPPLPPPAAFSPSHLAQPTSFSGYRAPKGLLRPPGGQDCLCNSYARNCELDGYFYHPGESLGGASSLLQSRGTRLFSTQATPVVDSSSQPSTSRRGFWERGQCRIKSAGSSSGTRVLSCSGLCEEKTILINPQKSPCLDTLCV